MSCVNLIRSAKEWRGVGERFFHPYNSIQFTYSSNSLLKFGIELYHKFGFDFYPLQILKKTLTHDNWVSYISHIRGNTTQKITTNFYFIFVCFIFLKIFFIVVQVQLSPFSPQHAPTLSIPASHPRIYPPLALSVCPLYMFLNGPSMLFQWRTNWQ